MFYGCFFLIGYCTSDVALNCRKSVICWMALAMILAFCYFVLKINVRDMQSLKFPPSFCYMVYSFFFIILSLFIKHVRNSNVTLYPLFLNVVKKDNNYLIYVGRNALLFYFCQGISSSFLFILVKHFDVAWYFKLPMCFLVNVVMTFALVIVLNKFYDTLGDFFSLTRSLYRG